MRRSPKNAAKCGKKAFTTTSNCLRKLVAARSRRRPNLVNELHKQGHRPPCRKLQLWSTTVLCTSGPHALSSQQRACQELHLWSLQGLQQCLEHKNGHVRNRSVTLHDSPRTLTLNMQSAKRHANVTQLVSMFSPRIANNPILTLTCIFAPTNDRDDMVSCPRTATVELPQFSALSNPSTCRCTTTGVPTKQRTAPGESSVFCTVCTVHPCLCEATEISTTLSMNGI